MTEKYLQQNDNEPADPFSDRWYDDIDAIGYDVLAAFKRKSAYGKDVLIDGWQNKLADQINTDYEAVLRSSHYIIGEDGHLPPELFTAARFALLAPAHFKNQKRKNDTHSTEHLPSLCAFNHATLAMLRAYPDISIEDIGKLYASGLCNMGGMQRSNSAEEAFGELLHSHLKGMEGEIVFDQLARELAADPENGIRIIQTTIQQDAAGIADVFIEKDRVLTPFDIKATRSGIPSNGGHVRYISDRIGVKPNGTVALSMDLKEGDMSNGCRLSPEKVGGRLEETMKEINNGIDAHMEYLRNHDLWLQVQLGKIAVAI